MLLRWLPAPLRCILGKCIHTRHQQQQRIHWSGGRHLLAGLLTTNMVYNYTRPRRPVAAMFSGPGPAYGLPGLMGKRHHDPRSVHTVGPAYPFGVKHGRWKDDCSPGPAYHPGSKTYRDGRDGTPAYSLSDRPKTAPANNFPGPAAYSPEKTGEQGYYRVPAYSFGGRNKHRKTDATPAPNAYTMDPMLGNTIRAGKKQAPCYSMRGKSKIGAFHEDLSRTPGPGTYGITVPDTYKNQQPKYTMVGKHAMPGDSTTKPGPGAHSPEKSSPSRLRRAPTFHMGIRHSQYTTPLIVAMDFQ